MTRKDFEQYFEAYNNKSYDVAVRHYAEDSVFLMPFGEPSPRGKENILKFFEERASKDYTEKLYPINYMITESSVAVELRAEYEAFVDMPDFYIKPMKKGEKLIREDCCVYDIQDGKITRVCVYTR